MKFFGKKISGPFTIPSGIVATEISILGKIAKEIPEIGILTTKSIGLEKREGNPEPIIVNFAPLSFLNAVGLSNPGVAEFKKEISKVSFPKDKFLLVSVFGKNENDFFKVAKELIKIADGFELNLSCPHSKKYGQVIGQDFVLVKNILSVLKKLKKPHLIKISPNIDYVKLVKIAIENGASGVVAINTVGPGLYLKDGFPVLSNKIGGISGKAILPIGLKVISEIRKLGNFPIIACGGISTKEDVLAYKKAGANFFGIGSALFKMSSEEIRKYFKALKNDLKKNTNSAKNFLHEEVEEYKKFQVLEKKFFTKDLFIIRVKGKAESFPGCFYFIWLPEIGEKPFSLFDDDPPTFLIRKVGKFTGALSKLRKNDFLYLRGPYGRKIEVSGKILLVGGGTGIAGISLFAKSQRSISFLITKEKELSFFSKKHFLRFFSKVYTDKILNPEKLLEVTKQEKPNLVLNCGPEEMVKKAIEVERKILPKEKIYFSLNYKTRCGIGLCGSCATKNGLRCCVDGPFFNVEEF